MIIYQLIDNVGYEYYDFEVCEQNIKCNLDFLIFSYDTVVN